MSTTEPRPPDSTDARDPAVRGVVLEIRETTLVVTVMPAGAPPYRARVPWPLGTSSDEVRVGSHVELVVGSDPADVHLAHDPPPSA